jgi:hypothetical protein
MVLTSRLLNEVGLVVLGGILPLNLKLRQQRLHTFMPLPKIGEEQLMILRLDLHELDIAGHHLNEEEQQLRINILVDQLALLLFVFDADAYSLAKLYELSGEVGAGSTVEVAVHLIRLDQVD